MVDRTLAVAVRGAKLGGVLLRAVVATLTFAGLVVAVVQPQVDASAAVPASVSALVPWIYLYPGDRDGPDSASNFIAHSSLQWTHDSGCPDLTRADTGDVSASRLGQGLYPGVQIENVFCSAHGKDFYTNDYTRPHSGDAGNEGYFLNLDNDYRGGIGTSAPVYMQYKRHSYVTFWFMYGNNNFPVAAISDHEGDWERISIRLDDNDRPVTTAYYEHTGYCTIPWSRTPKSQGRPITYSALGSHADYSEPGRYQLHNVPVVNIYDQVKKGPLWNPVGNVLDVYNQPWYGYGGGWGEVGDISDTTGPLGPSPWKAPAPSDWSANPCSQEQPEVLRTQSSAVASSSGSSNGSFENALQASMTTLWTTEPAGTGGDWDAGMAPGTSPSIAAVPGGYEVALQTNTNDLWLLGSAGDIDTHLGMMPGTSPSITALPDGGYEVAFQANTSDLWTYGTAGEKDWGAGMAPGTSPSITAAGPDYEVALQTNTNDLWVLGNYSDYDYHLGMMPGTSPAITGLAAGGVEVAFQANTSNLWTVGDAGWKDWGAGMDTASSPSITRAYGGYEAALQTNTHDLWTLGTDGYNDWHLGMMPGTSPAIGSVSGGGVGFEMAFQANTGNLWNAGADGTGGNIYAMAAGTSPAITST